MRPLFFLPPRTQDAGHHGRGGEAKQEGAAAGGVKGGGCQNLVFSPVSIYVVLSLVAAGARGSTAGARGSTLDEFLALLGAASREELAEFACGVAERALASSSGSRAPLVAFACGLWHDKTVALKPAYRAAAGKSYKADTLSADFRNKVSSCSQAYIESMH
ncbi:hypothetical protein BAE44_0015458 [Dichanthelium oligosanthes]|uniref:Serpin domain-containing protein n=1 Tax=Dichanthelium oligosanthes TaxID=888268 RepID=A0A1E5VEU0_9POAL|nr:hypothetical protein BAE44_0015458 [Dichanthelium oligosanthes]